MASICSCDAEDWPDSLERASSKADARKTFFEAEDFLFATQKVEYFPFWVGPIANASSAEETVEG